MPIKPVDIAWAEFKQRISDLYRIPRTEKVWLDFYSSQIDYRIILKIMTFVDVRDPEEFLRLEPYDGRFFPTEETHCKLSFFVGRDWNGEFQLVITPNAKTPDAAAKKEIWTLVDPHIKTGKKGYRVDSDEPITCFKSSISNKVTDEPEAVVDAEISFLKSVDSPFLCKSMRSQEFTSPNDNSKKILLISPFAENGKLWDLLNHKPKVRPYLECKYTMATLLGMRHMHQSGKCHYDIKQENMVVTKDHWVQYIDFEDSDPYVVAPGTLLCWPPEVVAHVYSRYVKDQNAMQSTPGYKLWLLESETINKIAKTNIYSEKIDIWCAGLVLYHIFTGREFDVKSIDTLEEDGVPEFIQEMIATYPYNRPSAGEIWYTFLRDGLKKYNDELINRVCDELFEFLRDDFQRAEFIADLLIAKQFVLAIKYYKKMSDKLDELDGLDETDEFNKFYKLVLIDLAKNYSEKTVATQWIRLRTIIQCFEVKDPSSDKSDKSDKKKLDKLEEFDKIILKRPEFKDHKWYRSFTTAIKDLDEQFFRFVNLHTRDCSALEDFAEDLGVLPARNYIFDPWHVVNSTSTMALTMLMNPKTNEELLAKYLQSPFPCEHSIVTLIKAGEAKEQYRSWPRVIGNLLDKNQLTVEILQVLKRAGIDELKIGNRFLTTAKNYVNNLKKADFKFVKYYQDAATKAEDLSQKYNILTDGINKLTGVIEPTELEFLQIKVSFLYDAAKKYTPFLNAQGSRLEMSARSRGIVRTGAAIIKAINELINATESKEVLAASNFLFPQDKNPSPKSNTQETPSASSSSSSSKEPKRKKK